MVEIVTLRPSVADDGAVQWTMCHNIPNNQKCGGPAMGTAYPQIDIPHGAQNPLVIFTIEGENNIIFRKAPNPTDASEAFYVEPGKGKNPGKGHKSDNQFDNITVLNGKSLIFNDKNTRDIFLSYKLHFQQGGQAVTSIDPDIKNGGGGGHGFTWTSYALVGAVAGALLCVLFVRFVMKWR